MPKKETSQMNVAKARQKAAQLLQKGKEVEAATTKRAPPKKQLEPVYDEAELSSDSSEDEQEDTKVETPPPQPQQLPQQKKRSNGKKESFQKIHDDLDFLKQKFMQMQEDNAKQQQQQQQPPKVSIHDLIQKQPMIRY